jgi:hypothetical protein
VETRDGSRIETALREAWEEIRLPADAVEVLGLLDDTETRATQFVITPVVGIVTRPVAFQPDGREIERVIEVPLRTLRDPGIFRPSSGARREEHRVHLRRVRGGRHLGATAPHQSSSWTSWTATRTPSELDAPGGVKDGSLRDLEPARGPQRAERTLVLSSSRPVGARGRPAARVIVLQAPATRPSARART